MRKLIVVFFTITFILCSLALFSQAHDFSIEGIEGPKKAEIGSLCIFKLVPLDGQGVPAPGADWCIIPTREFYVDSSGNTLVFSSKEKGYYTIVAAVVFDGKPKLLSAELNYGGPSPGPQPEPEPTPQTLKEWVVMNKPPFPEEAAKLAQTYQETASALERGLIWTADAVFSRLRGGAQSLLVNSQWKGFLSELTNEMGPANPSGGRLTTEEKKRLVVQLQEIAAGLQNEKEK